MYNEELFAQCIALHTNSSYVTLLFYVCTSIVGFSCVIPPYIIYWYNTCMHLNGLGQFAVALRVYVEICTS